VDQTPIIPLKAIPKKSKKRQAETHFSKKCIWLRAVPKKSKQDQANILLFQNLEHPYRTSGLSVGSFAFLGFLIFD